jgi:hypothetical protein
MQSWKFEGPLRIVCNKWKVFTRPTLDLLCWDSSLAAISECTKFFFSLILSHAFQFSFFSFYLDKSKRKKDFFPKIFFLLFKFSTFLEKTKEKEKRIYLLFYDYALDFDSIHVGWYIYDCITYLILKWINDGQVKYYKKDNAKFCSGASPEGAWLTSRPEIENRMF